MTSDPTNGVFPDSAVVVGGSLGGMFHAVAMARFGVGVTVLERADARPLDRGAGIVLQPTVEHMLTRFCDTDAQAASVEVTHRQFVDRDGATRLTPSPQHMISWGAIYAALHSSLPEGTYRQGRTVNHISIDNVPARVTHSSPTGHRETSQADLVVVADGGRSRHRSWVDPGAKAPMYAGYVAYRGVIDEASLSEELTHALDGKFTFFDDSRTQFLCYFIPGPDGTDPGQRRLNWVWYRTADQKRLERILLDHNDTQHTGSLPPGTMSADIENEMRVTASRRLPRLCAALVEATTAPFVQAITDGHVQRMRNGPVLLAGDAAFVVRPHTAASTEKAAADALTLTAALANRVDLETALNDWERARLAGGNDLYQHGRMLGRRFEPAPTRPTERI